MQEGLGRSPPKKGKLAGKEAFFVDLTVISVFRIYE
jgi:hypothetical protein